MSTPKLAAWPARATWIQPNGQLTPEASRWLGLVVTAALNSQAASGAGLQDQINTLQAGEMTLQPLLAAASDLPDILQPGVGTFDLPDIVQPGAGGAVMTETTWQTNPSI